MKRNATQMKIPIFSATSFDVTWYLMPGLVQNWPLWKYTTSRVQEAAIYLLVWLLGPDHDHKHEHPPPNNSIYPSFLIIAHFYSVYTHIQIWPSLALPRMRSVRQNSIAPQWGLCCQLLNIAKIFHSFVKQEMFGSMSSIHINIMWQNLFYKALKEY